jgi:peptidoglycan hydrolase CwlO-like protein
VVSFIVVFISEGFPTNTFRELPTVEARTAFLDQMHAELNELCRSIDDLRGRIREAQEEEERKKRKLEEMNRRLANRLGGSNPEMMDYEASAPISPRGEFPFANFSL